MEKKPYQLRFIRPEEWEDAMELAWRTFLQYEAGDYTKEGVEHFRDFVTDNGLRRMFDRGAYQVIGAFEADRMIGMIALRNENHISLLFVDRQYHFKGVAKSLMMSMCSYVKNELGKAMVTVNSSPYAVGFYHKVGFTDTGPQTCADGIIYTPMILMIHS